MGEHRAVRISHDKKLAKLRTDSDGLKSRIFEKRQEADELTRKSAGLAKAVVGGDIKSGREQDEIDKKKAVVDRLLLNLETMLKPILTELADAEVTFEQLKRAETIEVITDAITRAAAIGPQFEAPIRQIAAATPAFNAQVSEILRASSAMLDPEKSLVLMNKGRTAVLRGIRAELSRAFHAEGLFGVCDVGDHDGGSFGEVTGGFLEMLRGALQINSAGEGREQFRATQNISGLFGMFVKLGETVMLRPDDPATQTLISNNAIERVEESAAAVGAA